jgi:phospholipid/cholesterol/gamma-HCH transport system permease protein
MPAGQPPGLSISHQTQDGALQVELSGRLDAHSLEQGPERLRELVGRSGPQELVLDARGLDYLDASGALALNLMLQAAREAGARVRVEGLGESGRNLVALADPEALEARPLIAAQRKLGFLAEVGEGAVKVGRDLRQMVAFVGSFSLAVAGAVRRPQNLRWSDVGLYMERVGVDGLPIVGLISFLLGLIIAFMSSLQLKSFGANIFVADLVALAMVRELGPIMTAVLVAGRSGSAFAAEIGTMKVGEEVDALEVMGYDPVAFLAIPKVLAALLVIPLLTLYADLLGIAGGLLVGVMGLDLTIYSYVQETAGALSVFDITSGVVKSLVFALIIAGVGCQRGFTVRGGAQAVGTATTSAVVAAMFFIIVADSAFAIILHYWE